MYFESITSIELGKIVVDVFRRCCYGSATKYSHITNLVDLQVNFLISFIFQTVQHWLVILQEIN